MLDARLLAPAYDDAEIGFKLGGKLADILTSGAKEGLAELRRAVALPGLYSLKSAPKL